MQLTHHSTQILGKTVTELVDAVRFKAPDLNASVVCTDGSALSRFAPLQTANPTELAFLANPKYASQLASTRAGALLIDQATWLSEQSTIQAHNVIVCDKPYVFFAFASQILDESNASPRTNTIHPSAMIDPTAVIGQGVTIGAYTSIAAHSHIGDGCQIGTHVSISNNVQVGSDSMVYSHVTLYHAVQLGKRCIVHSGTVIGADGFGFAPHQNKWIKIAQTGTVLIGDDVELGSNCSIDRGALGDTVIGRGTKLDNLIQIAHNVHVGEDCAFAANIAIAGSAVIGNRVQMGGKAGVLGHLSVCDDVVISSCTLVTKTIAKPGFYSGVYPMQENADWEKNAVALKRLNALRLQVRAIEQTIKTIKIESENVNKGLL
jgi:UDP-3-O-[3-hydroxymyristoyl] glucosamine N-acyltransferase